MKTKDFDLKTPPNAVDPSRCFCSCGKRALPAHPQQHCPRCHKQWLARGTDRSTHCPKCDFNLFTWRQRNGILELEVPLP